MLELLLRMLGQVELPGIPPYIMLAIEKMADTLLGPESRLHDAVKDNNHHSLRCELNKLSKENAKSVINRQSSEGTLLTLAVHHADSELVKLLLSYDADQNRVNSNGQTPLMIALKNNKQEVVDVLINDGKIEWDKKDILGRTIYHYALNGKYENLILEKFKEKNIAITASATFMDSFFSMWQSAAESRREFNQWHDEGISLN